MYVLTFLGILLEQKKDPAVVDWPSVVFFAADTHGYVGRDGNQQLNFKARSTTRPVKSFQRTDQQT